MKDQVPVLLSIEAMKMDIALWRDALDMKMPMKDEFKVHMMKQRKPILENYAHTARAWHMLLGNMRENGDADGFAEALRIVDEFRAWAEAELEKLKHL